MYLQNTIPPACSIHQRPRINTIAPLDQFQRIQISAELNRVGQGGSGIPVYPKKVTQNTPKYPKFLPVYPKLINVLNTVYPKLVVAKQALIC